ncbi:hypothetical protein C8R43DRAFT_122359 [Mycena crocata]|nr:hypothetical protein C8R43DRAFT_122359 [Mycena crocata]
MKNDRSNERRDALLGWLTQMAAAETNTDVSLWCSTHEEAILRSLPKLDANQIPTLVDRSLARGGEFLRDVIFPQLHAQKLLESTWVALLERLHQASKTIHIPPSTDIVKDLVAEGVADRVRKWSAPEKTVKEVFGSTLRFSMSAAATFALIKFCVATEHAEQCITLFSKIREAVRLWHFPARFPPSKYYSVLFKLLMEYMKAEPGLDDMFQPFFVDVIDSILFRPTVAAGKVVEPLRVEDSVAIIVVAGRKAGGIPVLSARLTADAVVGCDSYTLQGLARAVMKEFPLNQLKDPASLLVYTTLLTTFVHAAIDAFPNSLLVKYLYQDYTPGVLSTPESHMMHLVKLCFEANVQSECSYLLAHFLPAPAGSTLQQHVSDAILPFLPKLARYLAAKGLNFVSDSLYNIFVATAVKTFAEKVMGENPYSVVTTAQIQNVGCRGCSDCGELSEETTTTFQRSKNLLIHLEQKLVGTVAWGVTTESVKQGSARILRIVKPNSMTALSVWQANSKIGQNLLNAIGDTAAQMRVLGEDYNWVNRRIVGSDVVPMDTQP